MDAGPGDPHPLGERLAQRFAAFAVFLRGNGFAPGPAELADALRLAEWALPEGARALRPALKALVVRDREEWQRFDGLFDAFFRGGGRVRSRPVAAGERARPRPATLVELAATRAAGRPSGPPQFLVAGEPGGAETAAAIARAHLASAAERPGAGDARLGRGDPARPVEDLAERLGRQLAVRLIRRQRRRRRGAALDLPATIRRSLEHGGWAFELVRRRPRQRPLRLAFLLDASASMRPWLPLHLRFLRGLARLPWCETHLFHTRLVPLGRALRERDPERAAAALTLLAEGVGSGTRIAGSLAAFNRFHAPRALRGRACAAIVSDGYDSDPPEALDRELVQLRRRARLLLWLDPVGGSEAVRSAVRGLSVARRRVDLLAPGGDLAALERLSRQLARGRRPRSRERAR